VTSGQHPQDDLPGLLLGELPPATAVAVDRHLAGCDPCRRDLAAVAVAASALRDASRLGFQDLPSPASRDRRRRGRRLLGAAASCSPWPWGWAA
jgi:anti-sigma factor RsiW